MTAQIAWAQLHCISSGWENVDVDTYKYPEGSLITKLLIQVTCDYYLNSGLKFAARDYCGIHHRIQLESVTWP